MKKRHLSFFFLLLLLLSAALYYNNSLQTPLLKISHSIKLTYLNSINFIVNTYNEHIYQKDQIIELREKLKKYEKNHLMMHQFATELNDVFDERDSALSVSPDVELVKTIGYAKFGDINKVWLQMSDFNSSRIYGLTYKELAAGIVTEKNDQPLALLNSDHKTTYAVYVGEDYAPGIARGNASENMVVEFIPTWIKIKVGDEVITSGLDNLFFNGLKVGKVLSIELVKGYQVATIKPYFNQAKPSYFHVIKSVR